MKSLDEAPRTKISRELEEIIHIAIKSEYSVFVGKNNSGKSYLLKLIAEKIGEEAAYIGPARYTNFNQLGFYSYQPNKKSEWYRRLMQWRRQNQNIDNSPINLQQAIAQFDDATRSSFFELMNILLGVEMKIGRADPNNEMSLRYVECNGHNLSYASSGVRLISSVLASLFDTDFKSVLIDEPELGISPEAQGVLSDFLFNKKARERYFPHLENLILATHSTIFLDRKNINNNYIIEKRKNTIHGKIVETQQEFNKIHFMLLGNRMEMLYLPSSIFVVEGKTDKKFLKRLIEIEFPDSMISIIQANDDSRVKEMIYTISHLLSDFQKSPYRDRVFPVLDSVHARGIAGTITTMGVPEENLVIWEENGIEHYYPDRIIDEIFGSGSRLAIQGDRIGRNGITKTKNELCELVCSKMTKGEDHHPEIKAKVIQRLARLEQPIN